MKKCINLLNTHQLIIITIGDLMINMKKNSLKEKKLKSNKIDFDSNLYYNSNIVKIQF